jgi:NAD(P)-dependent dehydrogenase (short-subunit alcohol dehydrogenase family)
MDLGLKGKVALITGAGSQVGVGKGIAMALAREGCDIIATDINLEGAKQTAADVEALGRKAIGLKADITSFKEVKDMVKAGLEKFGKIDILANIAGVGSGLQPFVDMTEEDWELDIKVNFMGTLYCTHAVLPQMLERKSGKIINTTTSNPMAGAPNATMYAAAKAANESFSRGLAREVESSGIHVNFIHPRGVNTNFFIASKAPPAMVEMIRQGAAAGRTTTPQNIGNAVAFLVSDLAKKITGQLIEC